jgi:site-specific recombinase XerD
VRSYFAELGKSDLTAWSVHDYARVVRTWLRFLFADGIMATDVMAKVTMPRLAKLVLPAFTPAEVQDLLDACEGAFVPERETALVLFLLDTGVRAAELCALRVADVDTRTGAVTVKAGKGNKDRTAYIGHKARRALLRYFYTRPTAGKDEPLFPAHRTGDPLTPHGLLQVCRRLGKRAEVEGCHPHKFRRTAAIWSLRAGMDLIRLAAMMGHEDLKTLRGYLKLVESDLQTAHKEHGAVDSMLSDKPK